MIEVKEYRGHIRNWKSLRKELEIDNVMGCQEQEDCEEQGVMAASVSEVDDDAIAAARREREEVILI